MASLMQPKTTDFDRSPQSSLATSAADHQFSTWPARRAPIDQMPIDKLHHCICRALLYLFLLSCKYNYSLYRERR